MERQLGLVSEQEHRLISWICAIFSESQRRTIQTRIALRKVFAALSLAADLRMFGSATISDGNTRLPAEILVPLLSS
ncbi:hypothetical protein WJ89_19295 [Burkholderia ubonensis]|uniref:Uncharacterized protein n=1 Tax=Burkholderia ubonensis TaxID=101571 RepID=A0A105G4H3_9BURK|nr:hypothetical protein WJ31_21330 [Burkholderia ubonensis]KVP40988.1 hypothetical protein WJ89_19295 [Burkholderia ubonensis]KVQ80800.1 hypothetical protein WK06_13735 [Burkholderia ubonensis]KVR17703.1 hypothetical protein WK12_04955 [Burkholderia ubonensis]KWA68606.1 hypothetical protein WL29_09970 [Burkholderia ubonensis]